MSRQVDLHRAKIEKGRRKISLHPVVLLPLILNSSDQRAPVNYGDVEGLHFGAQVNKDMV